MPLFQQSIAQMKTDKTGGAGHQNLQLKSPIDPRSFPEVFYIVNHALRFRAPIQIIEGPLLKLMMGDRQDDGVVEMFIQGLIQFQFILMEITL